jgi:hypothetical protein
MANRVIHVDIAIAIVTAPSDPFSTFGRPWHQADLSERGGEYLVRTGDWTLRLVRVGSLDFYGLLLAACKSF